MNAIGLGIFFILITLFIMVILTLVYVNTKPSGGGTPPKTVGIGATCNSTNLLCDITQNLQCIGPLGNQKCQIGINGSCSSNPTSCSSYPTTNGIPTTSSQLMTCSNGSCLVAVGNPCIDPSTLPSGTLNQCTSGNTCIGNNGVFTCTAS